MKKENENLYRSKIKKIIVLSEEEESVGRNLNFINRLISS